MRSSILLSLFLNLLLSGSLFGQLRLPRLVSDGMVLQREAPLKIWGWARPGEKVTVRFLDITYRTTTKPEGQWEVMLPALPAGGPYRMIISASDTLQLDDILLGDVWVGSGQSNIELPMRRVRPLYEQEIAQAENNFIRYFEVPKHYDFQQEQHDLPAGQWQTTTPEQVLNFSAAAYFFAKNLYDQYQVPLGIILTALGGSPVEAWMSEEALKEFPVHYAEAQKFKDSSLIQQIEQEDRQRISDWYEELAQKDQGYANPERPWWMPSLRTGSWDRMRIPGYWADTPMGEVNGVVWFRKEFNIPASQAGKSARLNLGRIVDADSVFINGKFVGSTGYQYPPRWYTVPEGLLQEGKNLLAVRVINERGRGGFVPDKPYELSIAGDTIDLKGTWQYKLGAAMPPLASQTFIRWKPLGLYQAMVAPLLNYRIKGVIWYQGESNTDRPEEYASLFPAMIQDWRANWQQGDFPFLFVQLANYMEAREQPTESKWALLREAQAEALSLPATGMAIAIDLGEWNDIHPLRKKEVGDRLALAARKLAYKDTLVHEGPRYQEMKVKGKEVILSFRNTGKGLVAKGDEPLRHFAVAGPDRQFRWAEARIEGDQVIVWHEDIDNPVAVRYAWADNPEGANLYNLEGFPAAPFRTDDWSR